MSEKKTLIKNFFSLTIAEFSSKGITIVYALYLANTIGAGRFGDFGFIQSVITFFIIAVSLGIDILGFREASQKNTNIKDIVDNIISLRFWLALISYSALVIFVILIDKPTLVKSMLLIYGINIFSYALLINWAFQGMEKMGIVAIRQFSIAISNLILILIFVNSPNDTLLAVIIISGTTFINTILLIFYYLKTENKIKLKFDLEIFKSYLKKSIPIGILVILTLIYNSIDLTMMGFLLNNPEVDSGRYFAAFKVFTVSILIASVVQNSFFPQLSRTKTLDEKRKIVSNYSKIMYSAGGVISLLLFFNAFFIVNIIFNEEYLGTETLIQILSIAVFFAFINILFSSILVGWSKEKKALKVALFGAIINIILNYFLIPEFRAEGAAISTVLSEIAVCIFYGYYVFKEIKTIYFNRLIQITLISIISVVPTYYYLNSFLGNYVSVIISIIVFLLIVEVTKLIPVKQIFKMLKKNEI